jgi:tRNA pseudouridine55 synthase
MVSMSTFMMDGGFIIDKPAGITSHDAVARVRRIAGTRRVGHAGTLDPFATGVLVVCVGRATRLVQFLVGLEKQYIATVKLGFATDTQDSTGKQISQFASSNELSEHDIERVIQALLGPQQQVPPMYSAKKVAGRRLYQAARAGLEVARDPAAITVYSLELAGPAGGRFVELPDGGREFVMKVRCSSGTYVRTLAHDIGARLGVGAHLSGLRRTAVGQFTIEKSATLERLQAGSTETVDSESEKDGLRGMLTPAELVSHLPALRLDRAAIAKVCSGQEVQVTGLAESMEANAVAGLLSMEGTLIAIGEYVKQRAAVRPRVVIGDLP